jgi:transcriptional regulator with XRE-family HTH domain
MDEDNGVVGSVMGDAFRSAIKARRKQLGVTQRDLAAQAGMSQSFYTEIEGGKKHFNEQRASDICQALGLQFKFVSQDKDADSPTSGMSADEFLGAFPGEIRSFLTEMRRVYAGDAQILTVAEKEKPILSSALDLFGKIYGSDRPEEARQAQDLNARLAGQP